MAGWQEQYRDKVLSLEQAMQVIQPGQTVGIGLNAMAPESLCRALDTHLPTLPGVRIVGAAAMHDLALYQPPAAAQYTLQDGFITVPTRQAMRQRRLDFIPINTARWPSDIVAGTRPLDVYLVSVSPPDEHGNCSFGFMLWNSLEFVEGAKIVIAEIDDGHIVTYGDNYVHVSQLDYLVEKQGETTLGDISSTMGYEPPSEVDQRIAAHAAALIRDGDTIQIGAGTVSMAVIEHLHQKNDLGLHSEICPTGIARS